MFKKFINWIKRNSDYILNAVGNLVICLTVINVALGIEQDFTRATYNLVLGFITIYMTDRDIDKQKEEEND